MADISAYTDRLGNRYAAHLLRRATFAPTKNLIDDFALKRPAAAVDQLLSFAPIANKPVEPTMGGTWVDTTTEPPGYKVAELREYIVAWMIYNMHFDNSLRSKMIIFLHQNWMVNTESYVSQNLYDYLKLLEFYATGSYKTLAKKMCRDNRMLTYLNGSQNTSTNPNENYAREFLELFTIGKGPQTTSGNYTTYTEDDIKAAAKVLSGYQYELDNNKTDPDTGIRYCKANPSKHSALNKTFSLCFGPRGLTIPGTNTIEGMEAELNRFIDMVFDQMETARNISRKLYRYFVHRNINSEVEKDIIGPLATTLKNTNYNIGAALKLLLQSRHFYGLDSSDPAAGVIGAMVKSPLELILQTANFFNISPFDYPGATPDTIWNYFYRASLHKTLLKNAGMSLFGTTSVAGYPAYYSGPLWDRNWFDSSTVTQRLYLGKCFLENKRSPFSNGVLCAQLDIVAWVRDNVENPGDGETIVKAMTDYLFPEPPDSDRSHYFVNDVLLGTLSEESWQVAWNDYTATGALEVVKPRIEALFKAILYAQEYQLK